MSENGLRVEGEVSGKGLEPSFLRWSIGISHELERKYCEVREEGLVENFSDYLSTLEEILRNPFPDVGDVEKYLPSDLKAKHLYLEMMNKFEHVPQGKTARKVFIRICNGSKYEHYRKKANETIERLKKLKEFSYSGINKRVEKKVNPGFIDNLYEKLGTELFIILIIHFYLAACFIVVFGISHYF